MIKNLCSSTTLVFLSCALISCTGGHKNIITLKDEYVEYIRYAEAVPTQNIEEHKKLFKAHGMRNGELLSFYKNTVIANKTKNPTADDVDKSLTSALTTQIPVLKDRKIEIIKQFDRFEMQVKGQLKRYKKLLPDFDYSELPIYGFISLGNSLGGRREHENQTILIFGIDQMVDKQADFDILFAHEAYHVYQDQVNPEFRKGLMEDKQLLISMAYLEGIATYASGVLNPEKKESIYLDKELKKACNSDFKKYAKAFLEDSQKLNYNTWNENKEIAAKWFYTKRNGKYLFPVMMGYCLAERALNELGRKHSLKEMTLWSVNEAQSQLIRVMSLWSND